VPVGGDPLGTLWRWLGQRQVKDGDRLVLFVADAVRDDPGLCLGDALASYHDAQDRGLEGHLQVVLDHHGEAAELLFVVVRIDYGLFDQRVQFSLAQFQPE